MKQLALLIIVSLAFSLSVNAQVKDTFDSNKLGWTEISGKDGDALIIEGKMRIEGKKSGNSIFGALTGNQGEPSFIETHCYAPIDVKKDFEIKCDAFVKKISDNNIFGIILNYIDEGNYMAFIISEGQAALIRYVDYKMVGRIRADIKLKSQKKADLKLKVKSSYQRLEFFINDMKALECRYLPLESNGMGFYVLGQQTIEFDNLEIIQ